MPAAGVQLFVAIAASFLDLSPSELLEIESTLKGEASVATSRIVLFFGGVLVVFLVQLFYPILTFATTLSLYYKDHLRDAPAGPQ